MDTDMVAMAAAEFPVSPIENQKKQNNRKHGKNGKRNMLNVQRKLRKKQLTFTIVSKKWYLHKPFS